jgi:molybdopterin converting factor small subunit
VTPYETRSGDSVTITGSAQGVCVRLVGPLVGKNIMRVEFLGIPRERAGVAELELQADTLGQLLATLAIRFPSLGELVESGRLRSSFLANLNGDQFVSDPRTELGEDDCVLILSADAGG